jgi:Two component regulator propeller
MKIVVGYFSDCATVLKNYMRKIILFILFLCIVNVAYTQQATESISEPQFIEDKGFWQEYHEAYPVSINPIENNVRSIAVDKKLTVWIATEAGIFMKKNGETKWIAIPFQDADKGPAFAVAIDEHDAVWMGTWKGVFVYKNNLPLQFVGPHGPVSIICTAKEGVYALGPKGVWLFNGNSFVQKDYSIAQSVRSAISDNREGLWVGSDVGLYHSNKEGTNHFYKTDILLSAGLKGLALDNNQNVWAAGLGGVSVIKDDEQQRVIRPQEGCPSIYATCVKKSFDGTMWVGTKVGVARFFPDGKHSLLFSRRWLMDDHVNDIAFDKDGNAWIATEQGVSAIKKKWMTLDTKQDYYYDVQMKRHIRQPWISGQCHLINAGDTTNWRPEDDDNDGEFTGNYLSMESFRYAVTKSEDAREKAKKAFHFLKQLKDITNGDGYFARTIVPIEWADKVHDGNRSYTEREKANELVSEPRFKPVEVRWHKSADGKWLWKGDASSDEWCGHMMGYFFYYKFAATDDEKILVQKHIAALVDHLIAHNFNMMDIDGTHTRWSVWSPDLLNHDPEWAQDRSENSMELLTFLKLAYFVTNDEKYQQQYLHFINEEHYLNNMSALVDQNPAWFIYYDVTMQAYLYPILLECEKDPKLIAFYQQHMDNWMDHRKNDKNPLINFLYCYARNKKVELQSSVDFLIDAPLDLVDWNIDHTKREDIKLVHTPVLDDLEVDQLPPASIRGTVRWDRNPWSAVGGSPSTEREPVFWLYPYWIGRYLKMIQ